MSPQADVSNLGRLLVVVGLIVALIGVILSFARALRLGSLPGDIHLAGRGWQVWLPLGTSLVLSLVLTVILNLLFRRR